MNYWIVKGNSRQNNWDEMLIPRSRWTWHTAQPPKALSENDRVFYWESSPKLRIIGLGIITSPDEGQDEYGDRLYEMEVLTERLESMPNIKELRAIPVLNEASFLKAGPATGILKLSNNQALILLKLLKQNNSAISNVWQDDVSDNIGNADVELDVADSYSDISLEGKLKLVTHYTRERDVKIIRRKKEETLKAYGKLACEVCNFDFEIYYGKIGSEFCEVHHKKPISKSNEVRETRLEDLGILCSNCHRMIHRTYPMISIRELKGIIKELPNKR